jgi:hypothetical protein
VGGDGMRPIYRDNKTVMNRVGYISNFDGNHGSQKERSGHLPRRILFQYFAPENDDGRSANGMYSIACSGRRKLQFS